MESIATSRPEGSGFAAWGFAAAIVGAVSALLLSLALLSAALGHRPLLWSHSPGTLAFVIAALWLVAAILAAVFGIVALLLRYPRRIWPALAVALAALSLLVVPATALAALVVWAGPDHPSDESMVSQLQHHRPQFDQAVAALATTGHIDREPLRSAGVTVRRTGRSDGAVLITVSSWGIVPSGSEKGYAYSQKELSPLTTGDSEHFGQANPDEIVYRHISGPWYIYYESW